MLNAHPAVAEGGVVAAPDARYDDMVAAVVVLKPDCDLDLDKLRAHFAESGLAGQKTPERLAIIDALPWTSLGKVRKAELRTEHFGLQGGPGRSSSIVCRRHGQRFITSIRAQSC